MVRIPAPPPTPGVVTSRTPDLVLGVVSPSTMNVNGNGPSNDYSAEQKEKFIERMESRLDLLKMKSSERKAIERNYLEIYSNPVRNALMNADGPPT